MAVTWSNEEIQRLVDCETTEEREAAFPDINPNTLRAHRARFVRGLTTSGDPLGWIPVPGDVAGRSVTASPAPLTAPKDWTAGVEVSGDSGTICSGPVEKPITDWDDLLKVWGLDPAQFEIVEPVTFKAWDTPAKNEETQEIITKRLFSYKARIQRKKVDETVKVDAESWRAALQSFKPDRDEYYKGFSGKYSYVVCVADPQLGKPGTDQAVKNWKRGIEGHLRRIRALENEYSIAEVVVAFMGDEHEGVVGNYASQPYEVELSYTEQIQLDYDLRVWTIKTMLESGLPIRVSSVPSNHGEHSRFGSAKVMTSLYDNSSTMVTGLVKRLFDETQFADSISWHIADDRQDNTLVLNGVKANFSHGHIAKGSGRGEQRVKSAIERQILGRTEELGDAQLFFTAHYHHYYTIEDRGRTMFGCPALEAEKSSDWFYSQYGVWSRPGMLGVLVGSELGSRGWSEINVL